MKVILSKSLLQDLRVMIRSGIACKARSFEVGDVQVSIEIEIEDDVETETAPETAQDGQGTP